MFRISLIGDHSSYHCGSEAAFSIIRMEITRHGRIVRKGEDFDLLVVNGEGSMHHDSISFINKMSVIKAALEAGKRVMLVNSVWQDNSQEYADLVGQCERVVVRERFSQQALAAQGVSSEIALDASYSANVDPAAEAVDFAGRVVFTDFFSREFDAFVKLNSKWAQRFDYIDMQRMSWSSLVRSLQSASLLVTGRHHAVYASCKARTPFLALRGNTHKIEGLMATAASEIPVFSCFKDVKRAIEKSASSSFDYQRLFDWMDGQAAWTLKN